MKRLKQHGYRLFKLETRLFNDENFRGCKANVFGDTVSVTVLGLPHADQLVPPHAAPL